VLCLINNNKAAKNCLVVLKISREIVTPRGWNRWKYVLLSLLTKITHWSFKTKAFSFKTTLQSLGLRKWNIRTVVQIQSTNCIALHYEYQLHCIALHCIMNTNCIALHCIALWIPIALHCEYQLHCIMNTNCIALWIPIALHYEYQLHCIMNTNCIALW